MHDVAIITFAVDRGGAFVAAPPWKAEDECAILGGNEGEAALYGCKRLFGELLKVPTHTNADDCLECSCRLCVLPNRVLICLTSATEMVYVQLVKILSSVATGTLPPVTLSAIAAPLYANTSTPVSTAASTMIFPRSTSVLVSAGFSKTASSELVFTKTAQLPLKAARRDALSQPSALTTSIPEAARL